MKKEIQNWWGGWFKPNPLQNLSCGSPNLSLQKSYEIKVSTKNNLDL